MIRKILFYVFIFFIVLWGVIAPQNVEAFTARSSDFVEITDKETVNENILITGQTILIEGKIAGDLICFGQTVEVKGEIEGDLICAAQSITVSGAIGGSLRSASQNLQIDGVIDRNATILSQNLTTTESSVIFGELAFASQKADIDGIVSGKLTGASQNISMKGAFGGDVYLEAENISMSDNASVAGSFTYVSEGTLNSGNAKIAGSVVKKTPQKPQQKMEQKKNPIQDFAGAVIWQSILIFALVYFFKDIFDYTYEKISSHPIKSAGQGLIMLIAPTVIILLLIFTIVGIPLAFTVLCLYVLSFFAARAIICYYLGKYVIGRFASMYSGNPYLYGLVGVIVSWIIGKLPIVGGLLGFVLLLIGFGGVFSLLNSIKQRQQQKPSTVSPGPLLA